MYIAIKYNNTTYEIIGMIEASTPQLLRLQYNALPIQVSVFEVSKNHPILQSQKLHLNSVSVFFLSTFGFGLHGVFLTI